MDNIEETLAQLSLEENVGLLSGIGAAPQLPYHD